jgi:hypothetical protein
LIGDEEACNSSRENSSFYRITQKASHWLHANNLRGYMGRTKGKLACIGRVISQRVRHLDSNGSSNLRLHAHSFRASLQG